METMRISERKKKGSKTVIICLLLFFLIGGTIVVLAIKSEKEPPIVGQATTDMDRLVDVEKEAQSKIDADAQKKDIAYEVKEKKVTDKTNSKIKGDLVIPVITIDSVEYEELNSKIYDKYTESFKNSKTQLSKADNKYTFKVSYKVYENTIGNVKLVSITVFQRTVDDGNGKNVTEKVDTYNINLATKKIVDESAIAIEMLGKDYKTKIKSAVKTYVVSNGMIKDEEYTYALTGLENFYIKDGKFHIYFNTGEIVEQKHGMLDITVE